MGLDSKHWVLSAIVRRLRERATTLARITLTAAVALPEVVKLAAVSRFLLGATVGVTVGVGGCVGSAFFSSGLGAGVEVGVGVGTGVSFFLEVGAGPEVGVGAGVAVVGEGDTNTTSLAACAS